MSACAGWDRRGHAHPLRHHQRRRPLRATRSLRPRLPASRPRGPRRRPEFRRPAHRAGAAAVPAAGGTDGLRDRSGARVDPVGSARGGDRAFRPRPLRPLLRRRGAVHHARRNRGLASGADRPRERRILFLRRRRAPRRPARARRTVAVRAVGGQVPGPRGARARRVAGPTGTPCRPRRAARPPRALSHVGAALVRGILQHPSRSGSGASGTPPTAPSSRCRIGGNTAVSRSCTSPSAPRCRRRHGRSSPGSTAPRSTLSPRCPCGSSSPSATGAIRPISARSRRPCTSSAGSRSRRSCRTPRR